MNLLNNFPLKRALICSAAVLVTNNSVAQSASIESQLLSCASGATDAVRLACYDRLADSLNASLVVKDDGKVMSAPTVASTTNSAPRPRVDPTTGEPVSSGGEQPANTKAETFGEEVTQKQSIRIMIEKTKRNARGDWYFYFDNGEVWKQIDTRNRRIPPLPIAATISRGIFSSYKLHVDGQVWAMKIRRVK